MRRLLPRVLVERVPHRLIWVAALVGSVGAAANVAIAALVQAILAHRLSSTQAWCGLFASAAMIACSTYISQSLLARAAFRTIVELRLELCRKILELPLDRIEALGAPEVLGVLIGDVQAVLMTLFEFPTTIISVCTILGGFAYLLWLSPQATAFLCVTMIAVVVVGGRLQSRGSALVAAVRNRESTLFTHLATLVQGAKELKLNETHAEEFVRLDLAPTANEVGALQIGAHMTTVRQRLVVRVGFLLALAVLLVGPQWTTDAATITSFILTFFFMVGPIEQTSSWFPSVAKANVVFDRIETMGVRMRSPAPRATTSSLLIRERIDFVQIGHTYRANTAAGDRVFLLGPLDLTVCCGEILFIVGGNGSGKSTLAKILSGLYWPERGNIRVDGVPIDDGSQRAYRSNFSAIFADFQLFERLFDPKAARVEQARAYLTRLGIGDRVRIEGDRIVTNGLSQGQRKRLALVRAYLEDRAVYIFDEWAADQDPTWKDVFYRELLPELSRRGKAVIVISHDDRYFDVADRLLKLDEGQLVPSPAPSSGGDPT